MGRRARTRAQQAGAPPPARRPSAPRLAPGERGRLGPVRRTLTLYLVGAAALAVVTLAGIIVLGGTLGPFVTLAVVVIVGGLIHRAARARLVGAEMGDEDRVIQTLAGGMLVICVVLAAASAIVSVVG
jgi:hypothetical protein